MEKYFKDLVKDVENATVYKSFLTTFHKLNYDKYNTVMCAISGGADSDIIIDLVSKCDINKKVDYYFVNTGLEYQATKDHIQFLQNKYNVKITTIRPKINIIHSTIVNGQPFLSKQVSDNIYRLQKHNFEFDDLSIEEHMKKYSNCKAGLRWFDNDKVSKNINIEWNKGLREFLINNPPEFKISDKCCYYAKKSPMHKLEKEYELTIVGIRKAEGGVRATIKSCFHSTETIDKYYPIFWYKKDDKDYYNNLFNIQNSKCYTEYGLTRTGCVGCPFGKDYKKELEIVKKYEPNLYKACIKLFGKSYNYMDKYYEFRNK